MAQQRTAIHQDERVFINDCKFFSAKKITFNSLLIKRDFKSFNVYNFLISYPTLSLIIPNLLWPMEPALISGCCSFKHLRVFDSLGRDADPLIVSSQKKLVLYLPTS